MPPVFLAALSPHDRALFAGLSTVEAEAVFQYLFARPRDTGAAPRMRSRAIGLYDPFCDRRVHPLGLMWQAAPYSCCDHHCAYCYARSYLAHFVHGGNLKRGFAPAFLHCLDTLQVLGVPPRHLSMANSSDVLQARLEREHRATLFMLEQIARRPGLFSSVGVLTKNPGILLDDDRYLAALVALNGEVQTSITFFRDAPAATLEPGAPPPSERRSAVERLAARGVRVVLRLDPLFPRGVNSGPDLQSRDGDLVPLLEWAARVPVAHVITSAMKLPYRRNTEPGFHEQVLPAFPIVRGHYRRMAPEREAELLADVRSIGTSVGLIVEHCFANILRRAQTAAVNPQRQVPDRG
jgi:DNA repair photolyase